MNYKDLIAKKDRQINITVNTINKLQRDVTIMQLEKELLHCKANNDKQGIRQLQSHLTLIELQR